MELERASQPRGRRASSCTPTSIPPSRHSPHPVCWGTTAGAPTTPWTVATSISVWDGYCHVVSLLGIVDHEHPGTHRLRSNARDSASEANNDLNQVRVTATYYYLQTYGITVSWQKTWGSADPGIYAPAPLSGSANGKPNSNAYIFEADYVPFGKADSRAGPYGSISSSGCNTHYTPSSTAARRIMTGSVVPRATTTRSTCSPG